MNTAAVMAERRDGLRINRALTTGAALGAHGGPGMLLVAFQEYEAPR